MTQSTKDTMTRADIVENLVRETKCSHEISVALLETFLKLSQESLSYDGKLTLTNFGVFRVLKKRTRIGRNPKTGVEKMIPARKSISFYPSRTLKNSMKDA